MSESQESFHYRLATPADEGAIRQLLADHPVPGHITLGYEREPDYFLGCGTMGPFWQVLVAHHEPSGELAGLACRATRPMWINGQVQEVGYLSQLRVAERFRGRWLVARGFHAFRTLHEDGRVPAYLATIIEENNEARGLLVDHPRRTMPAFREREQLLTLALLLRRTRPPAAPVGFHVERGRAETLGEIVAFLRRQGALRQFFPVYQEEDFGGSALTRGFAVEDFLVARRAGQIVGTLGLWDQAAYKQTVVRGYGGLLHSARPLLNGALRLIGAPTLPAPGQPLRFVYASFLAIADDDPALFRGLLRQAYHLASERGYAFLMVGLVARDPLLPIAQKYLHVPYRSRLYTVFWADGAAFDERLDDRLPALELAAL